MNPVQFILFFAVVAIATAIGAWRITTAQARVVVCAIGTILIVTGPHAVGEVRTRLYMASIEDDAPISSILAADPKLRAPMLQAIRKGFSASVSFYGSTGGNVYDSVNKVVRPFIEDRLSHASDETVRNSARETLSELVERWTDKDEEACHAAMAADNRMFYGWSDARTPWAIRMIESSRNPSPKTASHDDLRAFLAGKGSIPRYDVNWKMPPGDTPSACDEIIEILRGAISLPKPDDAAMLRALGFPRFVGQKTISFE
jgi:hypothetical protein